MRSKSLLSVLAVCGACVASEAPTALNPLAVVTSVAPSTVVAGTAPTPLTVRGFGFLPSSQIIWNGGTRPTTFVSSTELTLMLTGTDVAQAGSGAIAVSNPPPGGGETGSFAYPISHPVAHIDSVSPESAVALAASPLTIRIHGDGFTALGGGSRAIFHNVAVPTRFVSESALDADISGYLLQNGRTALVRVVNPTPGGGSSVAFGFDIVNPTPLITGVTPDSIRLKLPAQVRIAGSGFTRGLRVHLGSTLYTPTTVNPTSAIFNIPATGPGRDGRLRVENIGPGGGFSNEVTIGIKELTPSILRTIPSALEEDSGPQVIRVIGHEVAPDAVVTWNAQVMPSVFFAPDTFEIAIDASLVDTLSAVTVRVVNPRSGGPSSPHSTAVVPLGRIAHTAATSDEITISRLGGLDQVVIDRNHLGGSLDTAPSGLAIAFSKWDGFIPNLPGLHTIAPGASVQTITTIDSVASPSYSADGQWIYFQRGRDIWRIQPDGSDLEGIVTGAPANVLNRWPEPSPSGDRVVFARYQSSGAPANDLLIVDLGTGVVTSLGVPAHDARWLPDEQWIVYKTPNARIRMIRPDGTLDQAVPGTWNQGFEAGAWDLSPDGRFVLSTVGAQLKLTEISSGKEITWPVPRVTSVEYPGRSRLSWYRDP